MRGHAGSFSGRRRTSSGERASTSAKKTAALGTLHIHLHLQPHPMYSEKRSKHPSNHGALCGDVDDDRAAQVRMESDRGDPHRHPIPEKKTRAGSFSGGMGNKPGESGKRTPPLYPYPYPSPASSPCTRIESTRRPRKPHRALCGDGDDDRAAQGRMELDRGDGVGAGVRRKRGNGERGGHGASEHGTWIHAAEDEARISVGVHVAARPGGVFRAYAVVGRTSSAPGSRYSAREELEYVAVGVTSEDTIRVRVDGSGIARGGVSKTCQYKQDSKRAEHEAHRTSAVILLQTPIAPSCSNVVRVAWGFRRELADIHGYARKAFRDGS
ncbi:hypothetical protein C8F04DRAFT_1240834 [Mycena alexandri]|uniref:Uncharacterized protein n=1 Tax=Mycena alexandri TaxID=1745969 RepID=A0AAD6S9U4_9AGAR|nr:hypothetical protein C8F04DRAFT_1240834 [Mycena alexandri]